MTQATSAGRYETTRCCGLVLPVATKCFLYFDTQTLFFLVLEVSGGHSIT